MVRHNRLLLPLLSCTLLALAGLASAASYDAGTIVEKGDYDYTPWPSAQNGKVSLCAVDADGDGNYDAGEPLYLDVDSATCATGVEPKDIRLTGHVKDAGSEVKSTDTDAQLPYLGPIAHQIRFFDHKGAGKMDPSATVYLDIMNVANFRVDTGDLRVTAFGDLPAMSTVVAGDLDISSGIADVATGGKALTDNEMVFKAGSGYYINPGGKVINTAKFGVDENDVRLNGKAAMLEIPEATAVGLPTLTVQSMEVDADPIAPRILLVTVVVKNTGGVTGAGLVETKIGDLVVDARGTPTLAPGETATLVMTLIVPADSTEAAVTVGNVTQTVEVPSASVALTANTRSDDADSKAATTEESEVTTKASAEAPADGVMWLVVGLVAVVGVMRRRM